MQAVGGRYRLMAAAQGSALQLWWPGHGGCNQLGDPHHTRLSALHCPMLANLNSLLPLLLTGCRPDGARPEAALVAHGGRGGGADTCRRRARQGGLRCLLLKKQQLCGAFQ